MSGKSDYKKINSNWNSNMKDDKLRSAIKNEEIKFKSEMQPPKHKKLKRNHKKYTKRSDHKHSYEIVLVKYEEEGRLNQYGIRRCCSVCGKKDSEFWKKIRSHDEYKLYKEVIRNGIVFHVLLTEEEILKKFHGYKMIKG